MVAHAAASPSHMQWRRKGGGGGGGGGGGICPRVPVERGAPLGCNLKKNSKLSNKNKQILTGNERTGYPQSLPHSKFVAIDSSKCVSFWGSAPDPAGGAYSYKLLK